MEFSFPKIKNVKCFFGTIKEDLNLDRDLTRELNQVHQDSVIFNPDILSEQPQADGHATNEKGIYLKIKTADCQSILISHKSGKYIMALHVGWRGNRINFIGKAIDEFCNTYNVSANDIMAVRGPSLSPQVSEFINFDSEWGQDFIGWFSICNQTMNLWELTNHQLMQSGIPKENIFGIDMCTFSMKDSFYSYRRQKEKALRQNSYIWIEK